MERTKQGIVPAAWEIPEALQMRLGEQAGRQRLMDEAGHLLLILHEPPTPEDDAIRRPVLLWRNPAGSWLASTNSHGLDALESLLDDYRKFADRLDDAVESAKSPRDYFEVLRALNPLLRSTRNMMGVLQAARQARPNERRLLVLRDHAVEIERAVDLLAVDAKAGMDFRLAESGESQAREARRLNRLAAFFFPLATMAAVFGMNEPLKVLGMPGFWLVLVLAVGAGFLLGLKRNDDA